MTIWHIVAFIAGMVVGAGGLIAVFALASWALSDRGDEFE